MFFPRPATAGTELFDRLHLFLAQGGVPTIFDIRRLERDIAALEKADIGEAYIARSGLCAITWDVEQATAWVERACTVDGAYETSLNAGITLRYLNRSDLAVDYALQAVQRAPLSLNAANFATVTLAGDGRLQQAVEVQRAFAKRVPDHHEFSFDAEAFFAAFQEAGVSEGQLQAEIRAAMRVLSAERVRHSSLTYGYSVEPDGGRMLTVAVEFPGSIEDELRLEGMLAARLVDQPGWNPCKLSVEFQRTIAEDASQPA